MWQRRRVCLRPLLASWSCSTPSHSVSSSLTSPDWTWPRMSYDWTHKVGAEMMMMMMGNPVHLLLYCLTVAMDIPWVSYIPCGL
ncbi:hypothetical protein GBAR_LOCUS2002 [Geodia barretti]|uniref:Uncharacterized protein n=1 Tax=Geodia barretti TaxID=519541 RepID=A0AA35QZQ2_GEOBA|nr:hypothetical protein GBAR_LOCUS2002 [Geodia barretti]